MGRFSAVAGWVLVALDAGPRSMTDLLDDVRRLDGWVGHGTLLGAVAGLEQRGLIGRTADGPEGRLFRVTGTRMESTP
jgi:hypothetical protein